MWLGQGAWQRAQVRPDCVHATDPVLRLPTSRLVQVRAKSSDPAVPSCSDCCWAVGLRVTHACGMLVPWACVLYTLSTGREGECV